MSNGGAPHWLFWLNSTQAKAKAKQPTNDSIYLFLFINSSEKIKYSWKKQPVILTAFQLTDDWIFHVIAIIKLYGKNQLTLNLKSYQFFLMYFLVIQWSVKYATKSKGKGTCSHIPTAYLNRNTNINFFKLKFSFFSFLFSLTELYGWNFHGNSLEVQTMETKRF